MSPPGVDVEPLYKWRGPPTGSGSHRSHCRTRAWFSPLLASSQAAAQGRGQSWEEGAGAVETRQPMGEGLQGYQQQHCIQTDEEGL